MTQSQKEQFKNKRGWKFGVAYLLAVVSLGVLGHILSKEAFIATLTLGGWVAFWKVMIDIF